MIKILIGFVIGIATHYYFTDALKPILDFVFKWLN